MKAHPPHRVLLIAEAANPEWTSVPLIGWKLYRALAKVADVHLVTQIRNRDSIGRMGLIEGRDFTAIDNERVGGFLWNLASKLRGGVGKGWTTITAFSSIAYYSFEREMWRQFSARIAAHEFDLVHRITPLTPTSQSIVAKRLIKHNVPFVIGPLNGGVPWPRGFTDRQHAEREWLSHVRWLYKLMPAYRATRRNSAAIIVGSKYTYEDMPRWAQEKCVYIPENGVDLGSLEVQRVSPRADSRAIRVAFVGRLVPYKGADILLAAAAEFLTRMQLELHIIGDGPQRATLEAMVGQFGVRKNVFFHGWIPHDDVREKLRSCDVMALPSIREFGGGVVVEAMALGVPPVVADYGGPSELVDDATGFRVPFTDRSSLVEGIRNVLASIIGAPKVLEKIGAAARQKVREKLTWDAKACQVLAVYDAVLGGRKNFDGLGCKLQ
jgi:glycosyltransferase involved in cell wall biosynthesis